MPVELGRVCFGPVSSALESRLLLQASAPAAVRQQHTLLSSISPSPTPSARPLVPVAAARQAGGTLATAMLPTVLLLAIIITMNVRGPLQPGVFGRHVPHMAS